MKNNKDKEKRDLALQTPDQGKKSKSKTPASKSHSDEGKTKKKGSKPSDPDKKEGDLQGGHGHGNFEKGSEGPQGYGKIKK